MINNVTFQDEHSIFILFVFRLVYTSQNCSLLLVYLSHPSDVWGSFSGTNTEASVCSSIWLEVNNSTLFFFLIMFSFMKKSDTNFLSVEVTKNFLLTYA